MPAEINDKISIFVKDQFPAFYKEDGIMFQKFVEAYYEYLEQTGQSLDYARNLVEYQDVDRSTAEFLDQFKKLYLEQLPGLIKSDDRLTIKHILDFYRSKGSERSIQLLFRIIFDQDAATSNPGDEVIKPSTSDFRIPRYIECYARDMDSLIGLEGLEIIGATSGAKGFVESISTKNIGGARTHVVLLSNLRGNFLRGEIIAKTSDGLTDNMPVVTGSLSSVDITLGGQDFIVGDTFDLIANTGKQAQVRVTSVDDATGLIEYKFSNGGFGFSTNTDFTSVDVNTQQLSVNNVINAAQSYSNSSQITNAQFLKRERVDQHVEKIEYLSGAQFNEDMAAMINNDQQPYLVGKKAGGTVVANGYIISRSTNGANGTLFVAPHTGTFGDQLALSANLVVNTHIFDPGEPIDEESHATLDITGTSGSFSAGDHVKGDSSGANGLVVSVNSTVMTVNGVFGLFTSEDNVQDITSGVANTANVTGVSVTTTGANGIISTFTNSNAKVYTLNIHEIKGAFTNGQKLKGRRTNSIATLTSSSDTGAADLYLQANNGSNAVVDVYSNASVHAQVIGSNAVNVGLRNALFSNGATGTFYANTAAFVKGFDSNTYANVVAIGTGTGSNFKIGTLENEEAITIYTDFVSDNNTSNVAFLDCVIAGHESNTAGGNTGVGFVDTVDIRNAGAGSSNKYANGEIVTFATGGAGGGPPTTNATANVTTNAAGEIISTTVVTAGAGFYSQNIAGTITTTAGADAVLTANVDFGYGFPKDPNGDVDTIIDNVLTRFQGNIGSVATITDINPGNNYNFDPFVSVYTQGIAKFDRRDLVVNLTGMNETAGLYKDFTLGEIVNQTVTEVGQTLNINTITVQNTSPSSNTTTGNTQNFPVGSSIVQVKNSTVNAIGEVSSFNATSITIKNGRKKQTFANGFVQLTVNTQPFESTGSINAISIGSANTQNNETNVFTTVASNGSISLSAVSKGTVYKFNNNNDGTGDVGIRRLSFSVGFNDTGVLTGATSGAGGTIDSVYQDEATNPIGDNFVINADAKAANGIVTDVEVIDSGIGYQHGANLTLRHTGNSNIVVSGTANVTTTGIGNGYWASSESQLNAKYIHDNDFYQSHSYVVETGLSLDKYRDILLKAAHISGTRLFGRVIKESTVNNAVTVSNSSIGAV